MDEKEFFHQAAIRICGSLEIEKALADCFLYIRDFIPMDDLGLFWYDTELGAIRDIVRADASGGKKIDKIIPLPKCVMERAKSQRYDRDIEIVNLPDNNPAEKMVSKMKGKTDVSEMIFPLALDGNRIGSVNTSVAGRDMYSAEHARILALLHDPFAVALANHRQLRETLRLREILEDDNLAYDSNRLAADEIVGADFGMKDVMDSVRQVAPRENPVLIMGETGVGKELVAGAIHYSSPRKKGPFVKVNCGAIPESLIDSELFGHEKGAFTGALGLRRGRFERAHRGTIFLDEIGELPPRAQIRLLRVIQHREIERVGGTKTIPVDIRIISATHRNLANMVETGEFREDLWFRLNVFPIIIPPLRQRKMDIPALTGYFLKRKSRELNMRKIPPLAHGSVDSLMESHWKGNVRELENVVERALIRYNGGRLSFEPFLFPPQAGKPVSHVTAGEIMKLDEVVSRHIKNALKEAKGKISGPAGAAELLGVNPSTLRNRMNRLGITYGGRSDTDEHG